MKKKKIILIAIILVVILAGGTFAGLYFLTDLFKSPKTLFYKYISKSFKNDFSYSEFLEDYKTLNEKSYSSNSELTAQVNSGNTEVDELIDSLKITTVTKSIPSEKKSYSNIKLDKDSESLLDLSLLKNNDSYSVQCSDLYDKTITLKNSDLKKVAETFGLDSESVPDKFEDINIYDLLYVSEETREKLQDTYYKNLDKQLEKDMFSAEKNKEIEINGKKYKTNAYTLTLKSSDFYDILISTLETAENDDTLLDLIMEKYNTIYPYDLIATETSADSETLTKENLKSAISELVDELKTQKSSVTSGKMRITVYSYKGNTIKIEAKISGESISLDMVDGINILSVVEDDENVLTIKDEYKVDNKVRTGSLTVSVEDSEILTGTYKIENSDNKNVLEFTGTSLEENMKIEFAYNSNGTLGEGTTINSLVLKLSSDDENMVSLNFKQTIDFGSVTIDNIDSNNEFIINDMTSEEAATFINTVSTNLNNYFTNKLGVNEDDLTSSLSSDLVD